MTVCLAAECRVRKRNLAACADVEAVALETWMRFDIDVHVEVSRLRSGHARHALARDAESLSSVDSGRERHGDLAPFLYVTLTTATLARFGLPSAPTRDNWGRSY